MTRESHDSIADHYQQASLHLEAAAGHLRYLWNAHGMSPLTWGGIDIYPIALTDLSAEYEQRAQAALSGETIHVPD